MIKGLAITPPVIGRIAIGKVVEKNGKRLPEKDDAFTITTQVQQRGGSGYCTRSTISYWQSRTAGNYAVFRSHCCLTILT